MPVQVLLRGFEPDIPEDQTVTFSDDLPSSVLCIQCKNVSSKLYKDPNGHAYCGMCKVLGTTADSFNCSRCQEMFNVEKLVIDETIRHQLRKEMVICPDTADSEAFEIPFPALKTYLKGISSDSASGVSKPGKDDDGTQLKGNNPQSTCVICKQTMPKKTMTQHVKSCLSGAKQGRLDARPGEGNTQQAHGNNTTGGLKTKVECPLCSTLLDRKAVALHISEKCPKRVVQCKFCRGDVESCNKEVHEGSCRHKPGMCEHCQKEFRTIAEAARRELPAHEGTATHADLLIGHICKLQAENQSLRQRLEQQEVTHRGNIEKMKYSQGERDLLKGTVSALQEEVQSNDIQVIQEAIFALQDEVKKNDIENLKMTMSALQVDTENLQQTTTQSNCDTDILKKTVSVLQEDMESLQMAGNRHMEQHKEHTRNFEHVITELIKRSAETFSHSAERSQKETTAVFRRVDSLAVLINEVQRGLLKLFDEHRQQCDEKFFKLNSRH